MATNSLLEQYKKKLAQLKKDKSFYISENDLRLGETDPSAGLGLLTAKEEYATAKSAAAKSAAHTKAEGIRKLYGGYSGGSKGSGYSPTGYKGKYEEERNELIDTMLNREKFKYNPEQDELYQNYVKMFNREGRKASADVLGEVSSLTGGLPSSAATTAAAQTRGGFAAGLADKIPELYAQRYAEDQNEFVRQGNLLDITTNADQNKFQELFNLATAGAGVGDFSGLAGFGIQPQFASASSGGRSGGGSSSGGRSSGGGGNMFEEMLASGSPYTYLVNKGYSTAEIPGILEEYKAWSANNNV